MKKHQKQLIADYFSNHLKKEMEPELNSLLKKDASARSYFRTYAIMHEQLLDREEDLGDLLKFSNKKTDQLDTHPPPFKKLLLLGAVAAIFIICFSWLTRNVDKDQESTASFASANIIPKNPLAVVIDHNQVHLDQSKSLNREIWKPETFELKKGGGIHLRFNKSVDFIFQGPGQFEILGPKDIRIKEGKARTIVINKWGHQFTIHTEDKEIVDWGTEFSLSIIPGEKPSIMVNEGLVEIKDKTSETSLGYLSRFNKPASDSNHTILTNSFSDLLGDEKLYQPGFLGLQRKQERIEKYLSDDNVLAVFDFTLYRNQNKFGSNELKNLPGQWKHYKNTIRPNRIILNKKKNSPISHGVMHNSSWTSGRFPGSKALTMPHHDSHISLDFMGKFEELSFSSWIYIPYFNDTWSAVYGSKYWNKPGYFRLEMPRTSNIPSLFMWGESKLETRSHTQRSGRIPLSSWQMISTVFEKSSLGIIVHIYLNGKLLLSHHTEHVKFVEPGEFLIGNIQNINGSWTRALNAMSDELIIWKRALGSEEVSDLFLVGKPNHMPPVESHENSL